MKKMSKSMLQELSALKAMPETEIDFTDIPSTQERDWLGAERGKFYRPVKQQLTVRVDADVLAWLKSQGKGYQSRLNEILRSAMLEKIN
ncbi:MAG: BrnA antitoxin family protein [Methylococcaceae bacterium]